MQYPNNIRKKYVKHEFVSHSNRGMNLEQDINQTNLYYLNNDIALIYKKPTPIGVVDVSYKNNKKIIEKAYFKEHSTLDYNGLYKGRYIDFDAKETLNKTAFPLSNVHEHQTQHIRNVLKHGGIVFLIIRMNNLTYLLTGEDFIYHVDNIERKSISYKYICEKGYLIKEAYQPSLDYLKIIDKLYFEGV